MAITAADQVRQRIAARYPGIRFSIEVEQEWLPVRGNAMVSDDDEADRQIEDEIIERLNDGDVWAWAAVTVIASFKDLDGTAHLGACSYADEAEFITAGDYEDLCHDAYSDLAEEVHRLAEIVRLFPTFG